MVETYTNETKSIVNLVINNEKVICTANHPFYSLLQGWVNAQDLCVGDVLVLLNGEHAVVEKVEIEQLKTPILVYNFQVKDYHTYFVGESSILVHNSCNKVGIGVQKGNAPRSNQAQNKQFDAVVAALKLTRDQAQLLHYEVTGQGYGYKEMLQIARDMFGNGNKIGRGIK